MARTGKTQEPFFGRQKELSILKSLLLKRSASLVVLKGRRRIGKSRLAEEFAKTLKHVVLVGLAPEAKITAQMQREDFAKQLARQFNIPVPKADDWSELFWHLANNANDGRIVIVLDEINWMGDLDPTFLAKLKSAWDTLFKKNPQLIMILSGSMSKWIEDNILSSAGFHGRISTQITLHELPLPECNEFWGNFRSTVSAYEKFKVLSVVGGVPRYLEEIHPEWTAEQNLLSLCYQSESLLFHEFDRIFSDLFSNRSSAYKKIVLRCVDNNATLDEIARAMEMKKGGTVTRYVDDLVETGYLSRDFTWHLKSAKRSKLCIYRLRDNYLRFYLKFIEPHKERIERDSINSVPSWDSIMGLQFENLVLNNRKKIIELLQLNVESIVFDNPYFQKKTKKHAGCQIDYMIQTQYNSLHLCEIKFSKNKVDQSVIEDVKKKISALGLSRNFSVWPVLIHVNGVTDSVREANFFSHIIDLSEFLEKTGGAA